MDLTCGGGGSALCLKFLFRFGLRVVWMRVLSISGL